MFTIRFIRHDTSYRNYSVISYDVDHTDEGSAECSLSRKLNGQDSHSVFVGANEEYRIGYVTNLEGKTIDVIKRIEERSNAA